MEPVVSPTSPSNRWSRPPNPYSIGDRPRIAILKPGGLGDFLAITPAVRALRQARPRAYLVLIARPWLLPFCQRYPYLDRVVACPPFPGMLPGSAAEGQLDTFFAEMRAQRLDLALQWAGDGTSSNRFINSLGARFTAGFRAPGAEDLDLALPFDLQRHEVLRFLDSIAALGIDPDGADMDVPLRPDDFRELRKVAPALGGHGRYLGINPTSNDPKRRWPAERFAAAVNALLAEHRFDRVVLLGGGDQRDQTKTVLQHIERIDRVTDLTGALSLGALAALFSQLSLLVTTDSGPAHLAAGSGTPSVIIFGAGPPARWSPVSWTWQRPLADWHAPCRQFVPDCCSDRPLARCLDRISVDDVLAEAHHLLAISAIVPTRNRLNRPARNLLSFDEASKRGEKSEKPRG